MRALLASPLGLLIGFTLGALGGGGSILAVPALVYVAGQDTRSATATSLLLVGTAAIVAMVAHGRIGRVKTGTGIVVGATGIGGSIVGTALNQRLDVDVLLLGFSVLIVVAAWRMLVGCPSCTRAGEDRALAAADSATREFPREGLLVGRKLDARTVLEILAVGTLVGFLTGLFGVGGGFMIVPALTILLGMAMPEAIATSLLVIAINTAAALASRLGTSTIAWDVAAPFTITAVIGALVGARLADRLDPVRSLRAFAGLLVAVAVSTAVQSGSRVLG